MLCNNCNTENANDSTFCQNCGATLAPTAAAPTKPISKRRILLISGIAAAAVLAVVIIVLILTAPTTIVLDDYLAVEYSGCNGAGTATVTMDTKRLLSKMAADLDKAEQEQLVLAVFGGALDVDPGNAHNLSNGDTVYLKLTVDEEFFESLDIKIKLQKTSRRVRGLQEGISVNPFDYLQITYTGYAPNAEAELSSTASDTYLKDNLSFYMEDFCYLDEGDCFTVFADIDTYDAAENGYVITQTEKEITATGLKQLQKIDPFDMLTVGFAGVEGFGYLVDTQKETDDPFLSELWFTADKRIGLSVGQPVTITAHTIHDPENYGYAFTCTEKQYTVPELGTYVTDLSVLSEDVRQQLQAFAMQAVAEHFAADFVSGKLHTGTSLFSNSYTLNKYTNYEDITPTHLYYCSYSKYGQTYLEVGFVFRFKASGHPTSGADGDGYGLVGFQNLALNPDGTLQPGWENAVIVGTDAYRSYSLVKSKCLTPCSNLAVEEI